MKYIHPVHIFPGPVLFCPSDKLPCGLITQSVCVVQPIRTSVYLVGLPFTSCLTSFHENSLPWISSFVVRSISWHLFLGLGKKNLWDSTIIFRCMMKDRTYCRKCCCNNSPYINGTDLKLCGQINHLKKCNV